MTELKLLQHNPDVDSKLELVGNLKSILNCNCDLSSMKNTTDLPFGLGGGAVGPDKKWCLEHFGEATTIDGRLFWTPCGLGEPAPHVQKKGDNICTPFFIKWNGGIQASFDFRSKNGANVPDIYRLLFDEMKKQGQQYHSPILSIVMIAEASKIIDKALIVAPMADNIPTNGKPITDPSNIDTFFKWNLIEKERPRAKSLYLIMFGLGLDMTHPEAVDIEELPEQAFYFYITPGMKASVTEMVHNHGVAIGNIPVSFDELSKKCINGEINPASASDDLLEKCTPDNILSTSHIENDTIIHRAFIGVGGHNIG